MQNAAVSLLVVGLLTIAAWRDVATRLIPDWISLALLACGLATRAPHGWTAVFASFAVAALVFVFLLALAMRGLLGGGDVKLAAAVSAGLSPAATWDFITASVLAGGLLGACYILAARFVPPVAGGPDLLGRVMAVEAWRIRRRGPLPYAVALATGAALILLSHAEG